MEYINYLKNDNFEEDVTVGYMSYDLRIKKLYGYIYRGDTHKNLVLSTDPKFYGSLESSSDYIIGNNNYMKRYTTMRALNILDLSNINDNFINVMKFFEDKFVTTETNNISIEKKIMVFLVQLCFGIILNNDLKLYDVSDENLKKYLINRGISEIDVQIALMIKDIYKNYPDTIPSRFGIRKFDKLVVKLLRTYLKDFNIDGVMYVEQITKDVDKLLCVRFNKILQSDSTMCPPTEICIFNPHLDLGGVEIWIVKNGRMKKIEHNFKKFIKHKYKKLSLYDLYNISLLNKKFVR